MYVLRINLENEKDFFNVRKAILNDYMPCQIEYKAFILG